ncbi:MAG: MaoC family dehydratase N-terminal domain-containing protein, partial [Acidobacteriota bacterium]|nr:MaoC family dehydratase N-terminal domain-containing protein [Acidobacteriota bacterium]
MSEERVPADRLAAFEGRVAGPPLEGADAVNQAMIRHWVEAMGDENPVYVDEASARAAGFRGVVAPATMLQAWTMRGLRRSQEADRARAGGAGSGNGRPAAALDELFALLDAAGFTSVVATDCEQEYRRPLVLGDRLRAESVIESVSPEKRTALGAGHFVTSRTDFVDAAGEVVASMRFRILRFAPRKPGPTGPPSAPAADAASTEVPPARPPRPRPAVTADSAFFFEGARQGKLLIQRCGSCGRLRHPPAPSCRFCRSLDWDTVEASGRATLYSYVVVHHPQIPSFAYPLLVGLAELEEGTRLVADLDGVAPGEVRIGMPLVVDLEAV